MKLRDYMSLVEDGAEITCWDKDVDSEFYFYNDEPDSDPDFPGVELCTQRLIDVLDVVRIRDRGLEVNLYEVLDNPVVIQFAKDHLYEEYQYEDDSDVVMLLFDDAVKNLSYGFESFSENLAKCLDMAYNGGALRQQDVEKQSDETLSFIDDDEKMLDFGTLTKEEFLASYSYLTEAEYDATVRLLEKQKRSVSVENIIDNAKTKLEKSPALQGKNLDLDTDGFVR